LNKFLIFNNYPKIEFNYKRVSFSINIWKFCDSIFRLRLNFEEKCLRVLFNFEVPQMLYLRMPYQGGGRGYHHNSKKRPLMEPSMETDDTEIPSNKREKFRQF
jgi:hypothetical protein